ncbi:hypothetical protein [Nocardia brasiliensis]|uniref:hypothetical protein n=1 Tax=Nocardia brasiliensis TaxID=37326 RepID=UPI00245911EC|nr:hypothetical protein [Nocardia brasiliensis]
MTRARALAPVDELAAIITVDGVWLPSTPPADQGGKPLMGSVISPDYLAQGLTYLVDQGMLRTEGTIAQVWVLGLAAVEALGWAIDPGEQARGVTMRQLQEQARERLAQAVADARPDLEARGWTLRDGWETGGYRVRLQRLPKGPLARGKARKPEPRVDVVLEVYAWTTGGGSENDEREMLGVLGGESAGTGLPDSDTDIDAARVEMGRRLGWCVQHFGMLPGVTGSATGAALAERIWRAAEERNTGIQAKIDAGRATKERFSVFPIGPGPLPPLNDPPAGDVEPRITWTRLPSRAEIEAADRIAITDQRASYLAGKPNLALGDPVTLNATELDAALWFSAEENPAKWPAGLWRVQFPAPELVPDWGMLPPFHQTWWQSGDADPDTYPILWTTTETLAGMAADPDKGGFGIDWCRENIPFIEGWTYPHAGHALDKWQGTLSTAYKTAVSTGDRPMKAITGDIYKGYIGRWLQGPDQWGKYRARHSQKVWYQQVHALATVRNRRRAAEIHARTAEAGHALFPVRANTDDLMYLIPAGLDAALLADDDSDGRFTLGRMVIKHLAPLTDADRAALLAAVDAADLTAFTNAASAAFAAAEGRA